MIRFLPTLIACGLVFGPNLADAAIRTVYSENFNDDVPGSGITGPVPPNPNVYVEPGEWSVDGTGGFFLHDADVARVNGNGGSNVFRFADIGGNQGSVIPGQPAVPGRQGTVVFETATTPFFVGNDSNLLSLTMTVTSFTTGLNAMSGIVFESILNGAVVATTAATGGLETITHNLEMLVNTNSVNTYALRATVTQNNAQTFYIDNILLQSASTPEPASMSLLGMGVLAMCGAGYRRRKKAPPSDV